MAVEQGKTLARYDTLTREQIITTISDEFYGVTGTMLLTVIGMGLFFLLVEVIATVIERLIVSRKAAPT
jgi:hypothetical protein